MGSLQVKGQPKRNGSIIFRSCGLQVFYRRVCGSTVWELVVNNDKRIASIRCYRKIGRRSPGGKHKQNGETGVAGQQYGIDAKRFPRRKGAGSLTNSPRWPANTARMVSGWCLNPRTAAGRSMQQRDGACCDEAVRTRESSDRLDMLCAEAAISIQLLLIHLLDGPTADLQALGQFQLADSPRPLHLDVLPLLLAQAGPAARVAPLGQCAFSWPATERSLIEFRHHSLKASTIGSWSLPVDVAVSKSSARDRNSTPARCKPSMICSS